MANVFHLHLNELNELLVEMARRVGDAVEQASAALLETDVAAAEAVVAADDQVNALQFQVDDRIVELMTQYDPVATDLRFVLGAVRISVDLERMGDLAKHVAKSVLLRAPVPVIPDSLRADFAAMGAAAVHLSQKLVTVLEERDHLLASQMGRTTTSSTRSSSASTRSCRAWATARRRRSTRRSWRGSSSGSATTRCASHIRSCTS
jgi:phosphate transport system protein